ncbi:hypothetical protein [Syntrophobotulus glycolicus]|uniref:hypothetical protein n=1 Tax=Syntrophobotulus glycolicus TaxID=51197 RepID=UPI00059DA555|nr:hypothetical protein [Syntrophobotulus glycolicus]
MNGYKNVMGFIPLHIILGEKKYRGKLDSVFKQYTKDKLSDRPDLKLDRVFIVHSGVSAGDIGLVREAISGYADFKEILVARAGCTISSHCGPNTLGVMFMTE